MQPTDIDLDLLRCFAQVVESRSFTAAGEKLGRSQSAVSVRIQKLEGLMGGPLLARSNQDVRLTARGEALLPRARALLDDGAQLMAAMRGATASGRLRIGIVEYVLPHRLPEMLGAVQRRLPDAELAFHIGLSRDLRMALDAGEIDLALALHDPNSATSVAIATDPLVWVESATPSAHIAGRRMDLCLLRAPCLYRDAALAALAAARIAWRETVVANSVQGVRNAVLSGLGRSVLGASCLGDGLRRAPPPPNTPPLADVALGLHGVDDRKAAVEEVLRSVLADRL